MKFHASEASEKNTKDRDFVHENEQKTKKNDNDNPMRADRVKKK